mgnify:CR=1 FL=1
MAPALVLLLKGLASSGLSLIGNAVLAKGKEVVEQKLGVDLESAMSTEQGRIRLQQLQAEREAELHDFVLAQREQELRHVELDNKNTADARTANTTVATSDHAPWYQKALMPVMAVLMAVGFFACLGALMYLSAMGIKLDDNSRDVLVYAFGVLSAGFMAVMSFLFGSSAGSRDAQAAVASVARGKS